MIFRSLLWTLKRHPFLYVTRFRLLSKNSDVSEVDSYCYNQFNSKDDIPKLFKEVNDEILASYQGSSDFEKAKHIAMWLNSHIKGGPGLSVSSEKALKIMLDGEGGVCSDMAQIFNNFCVINHIKVREWGATRAPFDPVFGGHSFNEIYCTGLSKWILLDVSACMVFYDQSGLALSVIALYQRIRNKEAVNYKSFCSQNLPDQETIHRNFLNPKNVPFLICGYSNKIYDRMLDLSRPHIPVFMSHFFLYMVGKSYSYRFPLDDSRRIFSS